jgi:GNAT superfamily N-acetyltransferase
MHGIGFVPVVQQVPPEVTRPLRQRLFKQNSTLEDLAQADGDYSTAGYYAVLGPGGEVLAIGSARPERPPWPHDAVSPWRIRAVATVEGQRRRGLGTAIMQAVLNHVRRHGGDMVWLNGRTPARRFYERLGFTQRGDDWNDPESVPHMTMFLSLSPPNTGN